MKKKRTQIYADGADYKSIINLNKNKYKNLKLFSKETSQMFIKDAKKTGFNL